ncbi:MAG: hypothetical protein R3C97_13010 [Geminicoccaceae bacterium]
MSETSSPNCPSPRAFVLLAHHVEAGRPVADAARISGVDLELAERLVRNWAFMLVMRIIPFFRINVGQASSTPRDQGVAAHEQVRLPPTPKRPFSLFVRIARPARPARQDVTCEDGMATGGEHVVAGATAGNNAGMANAPRYCFPTHREHAAGLPWQVPAAASLASRIEVAFAPLVEKIA